MPYGVTVEGTGQRKAKLAPHSKTSNDNLALPNGPCRVAVSWEGPQEVNLNLYAPGRGTFRKATIPSGGGVRSIMVPIGAKDGEVVYLEGPTALPSGVRGTIEVYPLNFE